MAHERNFLQSKAALPFYQGDSKSVGEIDELVHRVLSRCEPQMITSLDTLGLSELDTASSERFRCILSTKWDA